MNSIQEDSNKLWELEGKFSWETWLKQKEFRRVGTCLKKLCLGYNHKQSYTVGGQELQSETNLDTWLSSTVLSDLKHKKEKYRNQNPGQTPTDKDEKTALDAETKS